MTVTSTLTYPEFLLAGNVGVMRQANALKLGLTDYDGDHRSRDPVDDHVSGACAECAFAKWLGIYWNPAVGITSAVQVAGDVGFVEVRSIYQRGHRLLLHDYSSDDRPYLLALSSHDEPSYEFLGWIWAHEGKTQKYRNENMPRPCFTVPASSLHPVEQLRDLVLGAAVAA